MVDRYKGYDEPWDSYSSGKREDSNEVIIIIRDGKVVTFIQQNRSAQLEGVHGDGI
ncbi:hypothetical protein [Sporomusa malonica]|uniref:Uncharacterized protein n=1 Tax=Sporomusa malonica TaxID=112901 RepID=A0A1W2DWB9_9FIRM|nr:hypothetical protein [Sporomusa malonica]SMD01382.1 hypothetical protein SAMN04488500_11899 [Sporomusa malonica]